MELNYTVQGIGPVVLFVHGLPTSRQLWDRVLPLLRSHFTCVAVDLPGFGRSPMLPNAKFDPDSYAHTLEELRRHLDVPSWHVIGHDAGSTIAVHYAVRYQEHLSRLVLCSPPVFPELQIPPFFRLLRVPVIGDMLALLLLPLFWRFIFPAVVQASSNSGSAANIIQAFHWPFTGLRGIGHFQRIIRWGNPVKVLGKTAEMLPLVKTPTLILHGAQDQAIPTSFAHRAGELIPGAAVQILDCTHFIPLVVPHTLVQCVLPFLVDQSA